jgi:hypothetical protein
MRKVERTIVDRIPGQAQEKTTKYYEWVCPECDYFEEEEGEPDVDSGEPSGS